MSKTKEITMNPKTRLTSILCLGMALTGCTGDQPSDPGSADGLSDTTAGDVSVAKKKTCNPTALRTDLAWYGDNRATVTGWLDSFGCESEGYKHNKKPIALYDWDNTVLKNDVGDAITFHVIKNDKVRQPPNQDWKATSRYMTDAAATALSAACGTDVPAGGLLPTSTDLDCADEMLSIYIDGKTSLGAAAFAGWNFRRMEPTYAWTAQLLAGNTHAEVSSMTAIATGAMLAAPLGATQVVGTKTVNGWLRIYEQTADVIKATQSRGYDVWVITASPQDVVGTMAALVDVPADHVIGIRQLTDAAGRLTYDFEGCGGIPDGDNSAMSYIEGKRCWVNKVVYGEDTFARRPLASRHAFGAGDSDTDIDFLRDSHYKLVLNRQKKELMCFAYHNENDSWRVNPMFIQPRTQLTSGYACATTACKSADGTNSPCIDDAGNVIPNQVDSVFGP